MKTKKIFSIILCFVLAVCVIPTAVNAADGMEIKVSSDECLPGETVVITIDLINNPGISSLKLKVNYDNDLSLQSVVYNTAMGGQTIQPQKMDSPATLMWVSPFADYSEDVTFVTLTFKVSENATPDSVANISLIYDPNDIYDMSEDNVDCFITNGKINIGSVGGSDDEYIVPTENSKIDYSNKLIFSDVWCETDISKMVDELGEGTVEFVPNSSGFIGTGSTVVLNKGESVITYQIVIAGDVNGDSVCDALDAAMTNLAISENVELSDVAKCAATLVVDKEVDLTDYQNIVNWVVSGKVELNKTCTVTFADYDGSVLKTETVKSGESVTPPTNPTRDGYAFIGWDKPIDNIIGDTVITAKYQKLSGPAFVIESVTAHPGDENVAVTISLENNPGIASIGMYVSFDSALTLTNIVYNTSMGGQAVPPQIYTSPAKLTWVSPFADVENDVVFVTLFFNVSENASGELPISLKYNANDVYDMTETNISFDVVNNSILIIK